MTTTGPHKQCATEYGYGDYYTAVEEQDGVTFEYAHVCIAKGTPLTERERENLLARGRYARDKDKRA